MPKLEDLRTVKQLTGPDSPFTEGSLRWLIFNADYNGLRRALVRVGRRVLIDTKEFEEWLSENQGDPTGGDR